MTGKKTESDITLALRLDSSEKKAELKPLTIAEFYKLLDAVENYGAGGQISMFDDNDKHFEFRELLDCDVDFLEKGLGLDAELSSKITALLKRMGSYVFELEKLQKHSINTVTIFDDAYPKKLRDRLKNLPYSMRTPPVLYYCGDLSLANLDYAGFTGARDVGEDDIKWVVNAVARIKNRADKQNKVFGVVSGGADGVDRTSQDTALDLNMPVIEYCKNMRSTLKKTKYVDAIIDERAALITQVNPLRSLDRFESVAKLMDRNKYIYATSEYTVVVKSALGKNSGTWSGANEALKHNLCPLYVRDADYQGNRDLIARGAKVIK